MEKFKKLVARYVNYLKSASSKSPSDWWMSEYLAFSLIGLVWIVLVSPYFISPEQTKTTKNTTNLAQSGVVTIKQIQGMVQSIPEQEKNDSTVLSCIQNNVNSCIDQSVLDRAKGSLDTGVCNDIQDPNERVFCQDSVIAAMAMQNKTPRECASASVNTRAQCVYNVSVMLGKENNDPQQCVWITKIDGNLPSVPSDVSLNACRNAVGNSSLPQNTDNNGMNTTPPVIKIIKSQPITPSGEIPPPKK